ncbi:aminopeptidase P family protein [Spiroplasma endosymbiont of Aspidapion aeneum]|uniref:M24 family metallopeptidase n=1 Tax=Spiroplasma endosymbiont of Aspidapion aeneum TaxID=3066276 RepID=UPI00313D2A3F
MKKSIINKIIDSNNGDCILLYSPENRYWFSKFTSSLGYLLIFKDKSYLFLDGRYITAARTSKELTNIDEIVEFSSPNTKGIYELINEKLVQHKAKNVIFESNWVYFSFLKEWEQKIKANFIGYNFIALREIKDQWEVDQIRKACDITHEVFLEVLNFVKPGITEKELARFVSDTFLKFGADKLSFDTIVASGKNGSKPHAVPSDKKISENEFVTLDMGCFYNGYCSDQTRTFAIGQNFNPKLKEIYDIVYKAQSAGIEMIKPGIRCEDVHKKCFEIIEKAGYGEYFTHGTGHGIGIEIHEEPRNAMGSQTLLQKNMCVTVEPGIYIPGIGGVRIEDDILVKENGYDYLTKPFRELQIVKVK